MNKNGSVAAASAEVRSQEAAAAKRVKLEVGAASGVDHSRDSKSRLTQSAVVVSTDGLQMQHDVWNIAD